METLWTPAKWWGESSPGTLDLEVPHTFLLSI
jgi:hypothetical protein